MVAGVGDIQMSSFLVDNQAIGTIELTCRAPRATDLLDPDAVFVKLLDAVAPVVADVNVVIGIDGDVLGKLDLLLTVAIHTECKKNIPIGGVLDHAVVPGIGDIEVALGVKDDAFWVLELPYG